MKPIGNRAVSVLIEARQLAWIDVSVWQHAIPSLPDGSRAHAQSIMPAGTSLLKKHAISQLRFADLGERVQYDGRTSEPSGNVEPSGASQLVESICGSVSLLDVVGV